MRLGGFILVLFLVLSVFAQERGKPVDLQNPKVDDYFQVHEYLSDWCQGYSLRPDLGHALDEVMDSLKMLPNWKFRLEVHTDCRAGQSYNDSFSQRRADTLLAYLLSKGFPAWQIEAKGMGEKMLLLEKCKCERTDPGNQICDEREHQMNRRLVIRLTEKRELQRVHYFNPEGPFTFEYMAYPFYDSLGQKQNQWQMVKDIAQFQEAYFTIYVVKEKGHLPWLKRKNRNWLKQAHSIRNHDPSPSRIKILESKSGAFGINSGYVLQIDSFFQKRKLMDEFGISGDTNLRIGDYQYYPEKCEWEVCVMGGINWTESPTDSLYNLYVVITHKPVQLNWYEYTYGKFCDAAQDTSAIGNLKAYVERIQPYRLPYARVKEIIYVYKPASTRPYLYILQPRKE
ncbi:MAG: OmpA family protein [Bacteroidetes bacterium]|nr:MAG: OmpA family protein [Bacteroidota bacterium]